MQVVLPIIYALLFAFVIYKWRFFQINSIKNKVFVLLFLVKISVGVVVANIYIHFYNYTGDQFAFFNDGCKLFAFFVENPSHFFEILLSGDAKEELMIWISPFESSTFSSSRIMIIINFLIRFVSFGNIYVHIFFFSFFSFVGLVFFTKLFAQKFPEKTKIILVVVFLFPSVLFWTSGIQKQCISVLLVGYLVYATHFGEKTKYNKKECFFVLASVFLLAFFKAYLLAIYLTVAMPNYLFTTNIIKKRWLAFAFVFSSIPLFLIISELINKPIIQEAITEKRAKAISEAKGGVFLNSYTKFISIDYSQKEEVLIPLSDSAFKIKEGSPYLEWELDNMKDTTFVKSAIDTATFYYLYEVAPAKTTITIKKITPNTIDIVAHLPEALFNCFFYPTISQIKTPFHVIQFIENVFVFLLILLPVFFFDKKARANKPILFSSIFFSFFLFTIIGLTTVAVGSIVRYKILGMILLMLVIGITTDTAKIKSIFFGTKK